MIERVCDPLLREIVRHVPDVDDQRVDIISFGLQSAFALIVKSIVIMMCAYALGILQDWLIWALVFASLRSVAGGAHLESRISCVLVSMVMRFGFIIIAKKVEFPLWVIVAALFVSTLIVLRYAPGDTANIPYRSNRVKRRLFVLSLIFLAILCTIALLQNNAYIQAIIATAVLAEAMLLLPVVYRLTGCQQGTRSGYSHIKWR